jgi:hypothetical protein
VNDTVYLALLAVLVFVLVGVVWWLVSEFMSTPDDRLADVDESDDDAPWGGWAG